MGFLWAVFFILLACDRISHSVVLKVLNFGEEIFEMVVLLVEEFGLLSALLIVNVAMRRATRLDCIDFASELNDLL